jgi:hypothetical protein
MQRIRIQKKKAIRKDDGRYDVLPLDPRDPDVLRVKARNKSARAGSGSGSGS